MDSNTCPNREALRPFFQERLTPSTYSELALRTKKDLGPTGDLIHAALLITSEAGEIADAIKKHYAYGRELDKTNVLEEAGDLVWGINLLLTTLGFTWEQVFAANIAKLSARYPNQSFNADHALNRDKRAEGEALASHLGG